MEELGVEPSRYEGPTGIVGVLLDAFRQAGMPSVSLWAAVPHYVSLAPSPRAALALCRRFGELVGADIDLAELEQAAEEYSEQVTEAVASDAETAAYVEELERRLDLMEEAEDLPSGRQPRRGAHALPPRARAERRGRRERRRAGGLALQPRHAPSTPKFFVSRSGPVPSGFTRVDVERPVSSPCGP